MSSTRVVNLRNTKDYDVLIDRRTKWGNPFHLGKDTPENRSNVVRKYQLWLNTQPQLLSFLQELKGKRLACWCFPKQCHGDILVELADSKWIKNWFSNMQPIKKPICHQDIEYHTVENFYQAMKLPYTDVKTRRYIASLSPYQAKARINDFKLRTDWDECKISVMEHGIRHKFHTDDMWRKLLLMTEEWEITEWNNWNDTFWGVRLADRVGENTLGKILMKVREELWQK